MSLLRKILYKCYDVQFKFHVKCLVPLRFNKIYKVFSNITIHSIDETVDELVKTNKSMGRFGDGELAWMIDKSNGVGNFERKSHKLSKRLKEVFDNKDDGFILTLPDAMKNMEEKGITNFSKRYWKYFLEKRGRKLMPFMDYEKEYYNTSVTRPYIDYNRNDLAQRTFSSLRNVWSGKKVLIIEGSQSRLGYNDNLFESCMEIKRIECPYKNAFESYDRILSEALDFLNNNEDFMCLISLGPTATVLSYDLFKNGYRALDVGHIDVEYEWYLLGAKEKINLPDKYVNEASTTDDEKKTYINDKSHDDEIISRL